jgi:hypothetical protein
MLSQARTGKSRLSHVVPGYIRFVLAGQFRTRFLRLYHVWSG